jgi:hypothetical protein
VIWTARRWASSASGASVAAQRHRRGIRRPVRAYDPYVDISADLAATVWKILAASDFVTLHVR